MAITRRNLSLPLAGLCLLACLAGSAHASMAGGWWGGKWKCTIDGRPARMNWAVVDAGESSCDGETCTTTSAVRWAGKFSDNGSQWVKLTNARPGNLGGLYFQHADGNRWYLAKPAGGKAQGWTTWQNRRYPLACWQ